MAGRNSIIKATITGDAKGLDRALGSAESSMGRFARNAGLALAGLGAATAGVVAVAKPMIDAASAQGEALSRVETIFGDASAAVDTFADSSAEAFAVSRTEALKAAGDFAGFFGQLQGNELADLSTDLVAAASDFASFNDLSTDEALGKFRSALAGSSEVLRQYGIDTSAAAVEAKALEMGLGGLNGELTEQDKNLARSAIILDQNNAFMGDFARTSDSLANKQRQLQARFADVQAEIGEKLLPVALALADGFLYVIDGVSALIDVFNEDGLAGVLDVLSEKFAWFDTGRQIIEAFVGYVVGAWRTFGDEITAILRAWWEYVQSVVQLVIGVFQGLIDFVAGVFTGDWSRAWDGIVQIFGSILTAIQDAWRIAWDAIKGVTEDALRNVADFFLNLPSMIGEKLLQIGSSLLNIGRRIIQFIVDGIKAAPGALADAVTSLIPGGGTVVNAVKSVIPGLASGGIVTSPTLALIGEAGPEAVVPLSRGPQAMGGFGGGTQVIRLEVDGRTLAEAVVTADRRAGGTLLGVA